MNIDAIRIYTVAVRSFLAKIGKTLYNKTVGTGDTHSDRVHPNAYQFC